MVIALTLWPAFVAISATTAYFFSDGELVFNWLYKPKRLFLHDFTEGFFQTLPYTAIFAIFSAVAQQILARKPGTLLLVGLIVPVLFSASVLYFFSPTVLLALILSVLASYYLVLLIMSTVLIRWCDDE